MPDEQLDHIAYVAALVRPRVQLAVGIGAGAAFAETIIAVGIDVTVLGEAFQIAAPRLHWLAAVEHHRGDAMTRQLIGAEQSRWPTTHHDHRCPADLARLGIA